MSNRAPPETFGTSREELQQRIQASPFNSWLGLLIEAIHPDRVEFIVPWKSEFIGVPQLNRAHGGVLAALAGTAAVLAVQTRALRSLLDDVGIFIPEREWHSRFP